MCTIRVVNMIIITKQATIAVLYTIQGHDLW